MCLDIPLLGPPSAPSQMKRLPESSHFSVERHWRWHKAPHHLFQHRPKFSRTCSIKAHGLNQKTICKVIQRQRNRYNPPRRKHIHCTHFVLIKHIYLGWIYKGLYRVRGSRGHLPACAWNFPSYSLLCVLPTENHHDLNSKHTSAVTEQHRSLIAERRPVIDVKFNAHYWAAPQNTEVRSFHQ